MHYDRASLQRFLRILAKGCDVSLREYPARQDARVISAQSEAEGMLRALASSP